MKLALTAKSKTGDKILIMPCILLVVLIRISEMD